MVRQSEFKPRFDPELGRYAMKHIHGEGIMDVFRSVGSKLFGKQQKNYSTARNYGTICREFASVDSRF